MRRFFFFLPLWSLLLDFVVVWGFFVCSFLFCFCFFPFILTQRNKSRPYEERALLLLDFTL